MSVSPVRLAVIGANEIVTKGIAALVAEYPDRVHLVPYPCPPDGDEPDVVLYDAVSLHAGDGHDLDAIATADWVIDLGPGGGSAGGRVVATGPPAEVAEVRDSVTAPYLARRLLRG